jgi:DNA-binding CsgD family transcriptional regulator
VLYGRQAERERLAAVLDSARAGRSGALLIVGEPGAGKSALLEDARATAADMTVLEARGVESESQLPYASLHQLLRPALASLHRIPRPQAAALESALGLRENAAPDLYRVPLAVLTLLAEAAEEQPLLCTVDDAQWIDRDSEQALVFAARRLHAEGVAMLFAARSGEFQSGVLPELHAKPLDAAAVRKLLGDRAGTDVTEDVAHRISVATGGNALAVTELSALLTSAQLSGREPLPLPLPLSTGVERLFAERVRGLTAAVQQLLVVAAADDTGKPEVVLGAAERLGLDVAALDAAEQEGLVRIDPIEVRFRHPLVRSAVYGTATFSARQAAHRALAEVLNEAGEADRYAWHLASATVGRDDEVAQELEQAARRARARNAFAAAAGAWERASELSTSSEERGRRLAEAALDAWLTGLLPQAERLIAAAEPLVGDPVLLANCHRLRGSIELAAGTTTAAVRMLVSGARRLSEVDPRRALELLALAAEGASLALDAEASNEIGELAASLDVGGDEHDQFFIGLLVGFANHLAGDVGPGIAAIRKSIALAEDEFDDVDLMLAAGRAAFYVGDDAAALRFHDRIVSRARSIGSVGCLAIAGTRVALAEMLVGRWAAARATAEETSRLAQDTGQAELEAHSLVWRGMIAAWQGDEDGCRDFVDRARAITSTHPMSLIDDALRWVRGVLYLSSGQVESAVAQLEPIAHPVIAQLASLDRIEAVARADHPERAERWLDDLEAFAAASEASWARARLAHCRAALAAEPEAAEAFFGQAIAEHARATRPFERARAELAYGEFLRRRRRRVDAREHLRAALETFDALGARPWSDRARNELRASGETARARRELPARDQLTPQELQVTKFVAQGLSNRDVGAQLFLSPRTVDFHLRNVFAKLGISSRTELATLQLDTDAPHEQLRSPVTA